MTEKQREDTCGKCRWFDKTTRTTHGTCKRNPPSRFNNDFKGWFWPEVYRADWCGEFKAKEAKGE